MKKLLLYFIALFVLFFACTQEQTEANSSKKEATNTNLTKKSTAENIPSPTPIPPPEVPVDPNIKTVPQAPKSALKYPKQFKDAGIVKYHNAKVNNNNMLDNDMGKYGQRINLNCIGTYDEVFDFYAKSLEKDGWVKNSKMDKSHKDVDVTYFSTNYTKDNYTLMHSVTGAGGEQVLVLQILKEN